MSYNARVINVMIASPGDVSVERGIIRDVIARWNALHSEHRKIVLLPIGWETHSSPEMGKSAQEILNLQILEKSDILIGVFWSKIGTPTNHFLSGSVEEIERHIGAGKPAMLYFSSLELPQNILESNQYLDLQKFKQDCKKRCLYSEYKSHSDFGEKLFHHLQHKINDYQLANNHLFESQKTTKDITPINDYSLTQDAGYLLVEASTDPDGYILIMNFISGKQIEVNGKALLDPSASRREIAKWEAAIEELLDNNFIKDANYKGEVFEVTDLGYKVADHIRKEISLKTTVT